MKPVTIFLEGIEPFSINQAYYQATHTRTKECRRWSDNILLMLRNKDIQTLISKARQQISQTNSLYVELTFYFPPSIMFRKDGEISSRKEDLSNIEKLLIDLLFHQKYGTINFNRDDKFITKLVSIARPADAYGIKVCVMEDKELIEWKLRYFPPPEMATTQEQSMELEEY